MQTSLDFRLPAARPSRFVREIAVTSAAEPKIAFMLLIVFLLMLYSSITIVAPQLNPFRPVLIVAVGAILMVVVELARARQGFKAAWPQTLLLLGFLAVAAISSFSAIYARRAFDTTLDFSKIVLIYLVIENTVTTESRLRKIFLTLVIGGLFPAIGTIHHYLSGILVEGSRGSWVGVFKNPNEDAYCLGVLVPLAAGLANKARWYVRLTLWGIIGIYLVGIFLTFSRGGLLGLLAALGLIAWKQKSYLIRLAIIVALVLGMAGAATFWTRSSDFNDVSKDTTFKQRIATAWAGGLMFLDYPIFGVGPGCSMVAYPLYVPKEYLDCGCQTQLVIHNSFVQVLAELGSLGFICFVALLGVSLIEVRRMQLGPIAPYASALEIGLVVFIVCSLSGGFTYTWSPYILFGLIVAAKRISALHSDQGAQAAA